MASELSVLAYSLKRIGESDRRSRDFTLDSLRDVITEFVACFPVYRTYVDERGWASEDRVVVERAIVRARRRNPAMESSLFELPERGSAYCRAMFTRTRSRSLRARSAAAATRRPTRKERASG